MGGYKIDKTSLNVLNKNTTSKNNFNFLNDTTINSMKSNNILKNGNTSKNSDVAVTVEFSEDSSDKSNDSWQTKVYKKITAVQSNEIKKKLAATDKKHYYNNGIVMDYSDPDNVVCYRYSTENGKITYKNLSIFDDENIASGQYGADQGNFEYNFNELIKDEFIWNEMQKHFPVSDFASEDEAMEFYENYFKQINQVGCGYSAGTNAIFKQYQGKEKEFKETFGFDMYTVDRLTGEINYNYEYMTLLYFNYINLPKWNSGDLGKAIGALDKVIIKNVENGGYKSFNGLAGQGNLDDFLKTYGVKSSADVDGVNRFPWFRNEKNIENEAERLYGENDSLICSAQQYDLYTIDGELYYENGGNHAMMVTGFTEDGKPIVSSWGNKYILDIKNDNTKLLTKYYYSVVNFD